MGTFGLVQKITFYDLRTFIILFNIFSRKIAIAIDEEQTRCGYLAEQMTVILNEHEENESLPEGNY